MMAIDEILVLKQIISTYNDELASFWLMLYRYLIKLVKIFSKNLWKTFAKKHKNIAQN